ncbi:hypothetical protein [Paenibacillus sp. XY044]|uniref:hypothetical protein n=1 Tax=Paenibacillus sp. XY044 TaxID=2026089 RepID=UPI000B97F6B8|nr:hypothetical protein [Paenibacillus sp. XY044]OZB94910.1 hypothetical protein CJP46_14420 [Paenibacillus sp. XY044]
MRKWFIGAAAVLVLLSITLWLMLQTHLLYPAFPIQGIDKKTAWNQGMQFGDSPAFLLSDKKNTWYISRLNSQQNGQRIISMLEEKGWIYKEHDGNGYFFTKGDRTLIATTQRWGSRFELTKIPGG